MWTPGIVVRTDLKIIHLASALVFYLVTAASMVPSLSSIRTFRGQPVFTVPFVVQLIYYGDAARTIETQASLPWRTGYHSAYLCAVVPNPLILALAARLATIVVCLFHVLSIKTEPCSALRILTIPNNTLCHYDQKHP